MPTPSRQPLKARRAGTPPLVELLFRRTARATQTQRRALAKMASLSHKSSCMKGSDGTFDQETTTCLRIPKDVDRLSDVMPIKNWPRSERRSDVGLVLIKKSSAS